MKQTTINHLCIISIFLGGLSLGFMTSQKNIVGFWIFSLLAIILSSVGLGFYDDKESKDGQ